jgi:hypothetical protein
MSTISFDKLSMYDRPAEPVTLAIPFGRGILQDAEVVSLYDGEQKLSRQIRVTATWDDDSVKWLLVQVMPNLPGNEPHQLRFETEGGEPTSMTGPTIKVSEQDDVVSVDTGALQVEIGKGCSGLFKSLILNGKDTLHDAVSGFEITDADGVTYTTSGDAIDQVRVVDAGPLRTEVEVCGTHQAENGDKLFDYVVRFAFWAGKPWVEVEYQFINREPSGDTILKAIGLRVRPEECAEPRLALGEGYYRTSIKEGPGESLLDQDTILYQAVEHVLETFYGDFWADWCDASGGVAVTQFQAHQNFPKRLKVDSTGIDVDIFPDSQPPVNIIQGVAKTHRFLFHFHDADVSLDDICVRSLQFQMPDIAMLPESVYRDAAVWENLFPDRLCRPIESALIDMADNRARGLGMIHWGDGPDAGYTQQGRGKGDLVWTNNEYDFPHAMYLLFAKTGERRFRDIATVAAQHWVDVDFCHHSDDPLKMGGQPIHTANHVTGGVTPSHEWTEGLLDFYHFTGRREGLDKAVSIADNMLRHLESPKFKNAGGFAARETGWAMRGLVGVYQETREQKYLSACDAIAEQFMDWKKEWGAFLAPYTSHTQVRVPFMIAIAVNALARYHAVTGDERVETLIVEEMRDLMTHCVMPDGRFFYKELPSLNRRAGGSREMEALCHAFRISKDELFLNQASLMMDTMAEKGFSHGGGGGKTIAGDGIVFGGAGPKTFASFYVPFMVAYKTLSDQGRLSHLDDRS